MRTLYLFDMVTLDGFFDGPNKDISWHNVDEEFRELAIDQLNKTDLLVFGTSHVRTDGKLLADSDSN